MSKCHVNAASRHTTQRPTTPAFQSAIPNSLLCRHLGPHSLSLTFSGICGVSLSAGDGELSPRARISSAVSKPGKHRADWYLWRPTSWESAWRDPASCRVFAGEHCRARDCVWKLSIFPLVLTIRIFWCFFPPVTLNLASNNKVMFYAKVLKMLFSRKLSKLPERV